MDDIHKIIREKEDIERKIKALGEILIHNKNVGMTESLVDAEQFPRSDIDVFQVRKARHDIICLQNDHKNIMKKIEIALQNIHKNTGSNPDPNGTDVSMPSVFLSSFACINKVDKFSPAEIDGLKEKDLICKFGSVCYENFRSIENIAEVVRNSRNNPIQVIVRRNGKEVIVHLTPRQWSGHGLLGCNIVPEENIER